MFQLCFNFNRIHDSVGKALRTANQARVTVNSHALLSSFHSVLTILLCGINACFPSISTGYKLPAKRKYANDLINCPVSVHLYIQVFLGRTVSVSCRLFSSLVVYAVKILCLKVLLTVHSWRTTSRHGDQILEQILDFIFFMLCRCDSCVVSNFCGRGSIGKLL